MISDSHIAKNIGGSWLGLIADALTGFLLTPFLLHRLGSIAFGLWVLVSTFSGYYGLLDLGTRNAIIRFTARYSAQDDWDGFRRIVSSAFGGYCALASLVLIATALVAVFADGLFRIDDEMLREARVLIVIVGVGSALNLPLSVFGGVLEGLQHFSTIGVIQAIAAVVRASAIFMSVIAGGGVIAVAVVTIAVNATASLINWRLAVRATQGARVSVAMMGFAPMRDLAQFGIVTFWIALANKLRYQADTLIIGALIGVSHIPVYAIGARVVGYATEVIAAMAGVFTPVFSALHARNATLELEKALHKGNLYSAFLAFPIAAGIVTLGDEFIQAWVGVGYESAYLIMVVLGLPMCVLFAQSASTRVLYGIAKHRFLAQMLLCEGVANVLLSIVLARRHGVLGVAFGTAIPLAINALFVLPWYVCRVMKISITQYLRSYVAPAVAIAPVIVVGTVMQQLFASDRAAVVISVMILAGGLYLASFAIARRAELTAFSRAKTPDITTQ